MMAGDLHSALKTEVVGEVSAGGVSFKHVRLQHGQQAFTETLHARPASYSTAGIQSTDFLHFLGFSRSPCAFHAGECYCRVLPPGAELVGLATSIASALEKFNRAASALENCGLYIDQPEGWGFFHGKLESGRIHHPRRPSGNGHIAPKSERMKESEDEYFRFVFSWIEGASDKGWTTHYRAKHMPLAAEFQAALSFLGGFVWFPDCPEFDFKGCWWRFTPFRAESDRFFGSNAEYAHCEFDAHATQFSPGLSQLLAAHADLAPHGLSFLTVPAVDLRAAPAVPGRSSVQTGNATAPPSGVPERFDVALSFAGTERDLAEELATRVRAAGFQVFYDGFYPEQLWGKDLPAFFDHVYRNASRFCVMFVSREYAERMWTTHERRSAQARALKEKGREYILPIRVDETDLDGLPPTTGYVSLRERSVEKIATLLVTKLRLEKG